VERDPISYVWKEAKLLALGKEPKSREGDSGTAPPNVSKLSVKTEYWVE
jgi:hypothetical protein